MSTEDRFALDLMGAAWVKSSYSDGGQQCVEVAVNLPGLAPVRDSKDPEGPALIFPRAAFADFVNAAGGGKFGAL
ncbi:hypothetical protein SSP35_03_02970 [Streptomyces sp. NBRC 110611]|uniref:DUF397 domain-containing protein n=1 Tax=Streptomyces sp. NBRC 110611 TaxID=1621259 RepID=UPI00082984C8|nr:DUF397 domain-containing protein [Streptomyces sp. NBRC 110611]GAU66649.1 hypothetical protein SSP35_03_02970 [Streptomyces sp. NBRC 110611]